MSAKHPYLVSTAAAARLLIKASTVVSNGVTGSLVSQLGEILRGHASVESIDWDSFGAEAIELRDALTKAISRSQRARSNALKRRNTPATEAPSHAETEVAKPEPEAMPQPVATPESQPQRVPAEYPEPPEAVDVQPRNTRSWGNFPDYYVNMLNGRPPF